MAQPAKRARPGLSLLARSGHLEYDRVLFFSDAIFAIAITLLVIDIKAPGYTDPAQQLHHAASNMLSFGISFAVIGLFWMGHHFIFRYITMLDRPVIAINLVFLGIIAFLPYPTSLLGSGTKTIATVFYAVCISCAGLAELAVWVYASWVKDFLVPGTSPAVRRYITLRVARIPLVFLLSIPVALISPTLASLCWILIAVLGALLDRFGRPAAEQEDLEQEDLGKSVDPAG